jgi:hypothetical protein
MTQDALKDDVEVTDDDGTLPWLKARKVRKINRDGADKERNCQSVKSDGDSRCT